MPSQASHPRHNHQGVAGRVWDLGQAPAQGREWEAADRVEAPRPEAAWVPVAVRVLALAAEWDQVPAVLGQVAAQDPDLKAVRAQVVLDLAAAWDRVVRVRAAAWGPVRVEAVAGGNKDSRPKRWARPEEKVTPFPPALHNVDIGLHVNQIPKEKICEGSNTD